MGNGIKQWKQWKAMQNNETQWNTMLHWKRMNASATKKSIKTTAEYAISNDNVWKVIEQAITNNETWWKAVENNKKKQRNAIQRNEK